MTQVRAAADVIENYRPEVIALIERIEREIQGSLCAVKSGNVVFEAAKRCVRYRRT